MIRSVAFPALNSHLAAGRRLSAPDPGMRRARRRARVACVALLSLALVAATSPAEALTRFVAPTGTDVAPCAPQSAACRSIGFALALAATGDVIRVAAGTYTTPLESFPLLIATDVSLVGAGSAATIVDGAQSASVVQIGSGRTVTISGVTIQNGRTGTVGGGIGGPARGPLTGPVSLTLADVALRSNTVSSAVNGAIGGGLGLDVTGSLAVSLTDVTVAGNTAETTADEQPAFGGGIALQADGAIQLSATRVTVTGNTARAGGNGNNSGGAFGGGVLVNGAGALTATLLDIALTDNTAVSTAGVTAGGGLLFMVAAGSQTLTNVTASGNASINQTTNQNNAAFAGGIGLVTPDATVTNSTLSGNRVEAADSAVGGGIAIATTEQSTAPTVVTLVNVTIGANTATAPSLAIGGAGIFGPATLRFLNTIVTSATGLDCGTQGGTFTSLGHNLEGANDCLFSGPGDLSNTDPGLLPLANNGGFTQTQALPPDSPAVNAGTNQGCPSTDQRGVPRPQGTACDIGAYELVDATAVPLLDPPAMAVMALLMAGGALFALRRAGAA